jgi:hypothetical protein
VHAQVPQAHDPDALRRALLAVRVDRDRPEGLPRDIAYIDLVGLRREDAAERLRRESSASLLGQRARPTSAPPFRAAADRAPIGCARRSLAATVGPTRISDGASGRT